MNTTRRDFLLGGMSAGLALPVLPSWLRASSSAAEDRILVVLNLAGGNDGASTVMPSEHAVYQAARPTIRIAPDAAMQIGVSPAVGNLYLHPGLAAFKRLFDQGKLALVQGVGYPNPSFSHFRSEDIWYSANPVSTIFQKGWLGTYFKDLYQGGFSIPAIDLEARLNKSFAGMPGVPTLTNPNNFAFLTDPANAATDGRTEVGLIGTNAAALRPTAHPNLQFVADSIQKAGQDVTLLQTTGAGYVPKVTYPAGNALNGVFQLAARYITGNSTSPGNGLDTRCYYIKTGGFDLHSNGGSNAGNQNNLHVRYSGVIEAFLNDLAAWGHDHRVIVLVFSEFGRRFGENGSAGTDHGSGSVCWVAGAPVKGGLYGDYPDINLLQPPYYQRNLDFTTDFRNVYARILSKWWGADPTRVIPNGFVPNYTKVDFLA